MKFPGVISLRQDLPTRPTPPTLEEER